MSYQADWGPGGFFDEALRDFGFDAPSRASSSVGGRAVKVLAENIHDRAVRFEGYDGRWPDNSDATIRKKGFNAPNYVNGDMLSVEQIAGDVAVSKHEAAMAYGKDEENRRKAAFAHGVGGDSGDQGQGPHGVTRPFMGITESDADRVADGFMDDLMNHLARG